MINPAFIKTAIAVSIIGFLASVFLYGNPWASQLYRKSTKIGIIKTWKNHSRFLFMSFCIILTQVLLFSWIFSIITIHPGTEWVSAGLYYSLFICLMRIIPRFMDMFMMVNYPLKLLILELINGCLISIIMGMGISYFLY